MLFRCQSAILLQRQPFVSRPVAQRRSLILSTKYFRVCLFCLRSISSEMPCRMMAKFCTLQTCTDHVQKHLLGFMSKGVVVTKK